jgi:DNA primase
VRIRNEDIDLLLSKLHIEDIVGEFVELKKTGANYKGLCPNPEHNDTNPSFIVNPNKNICHCFVCGFGGNPISFYSKYKKITFSEAAVELAQKYNISVKTIDSNFKQDAKYDRYYNIMEDAYEFYKNNIFENHSQPALEYLSKREMNPKIIRENGIGYAPTTGWGILNDYLLSMGYTKEELLELGLIRENDKGSYDFFRGRIIFPIYSTAGKVIAFGGRTIEIGENIPKYINSQDTPIFKKGKNLYGIERGNIIKKKKYAILMEGYMDVLSATIYGFDVAVAPLGTALTEEQAKLLKNYTSNVLISFDSDPPGQMATEKAGFILKNLGFIVRVIKFEGAKDPDEFLKLYGREAFLDVVRNSLEIYDFLYEYYAKDYDLSDHISKQNFVKKFKEFFKNVEDRLEKSLYIDKLSKSLGIDKNVLIEELVVSNAKDIKPFANEYKSEITNFNENKIVTKLEKETIVEILRDVNNYKYFKLKEIKGTLSKKIFYYLEDCNFNEPIKVCMDLKNLGDMSEEEEKILDEIICLSIDTVNNEKERTTKLADIFRAWVIEEIENYKKNITNLTDKVKIGRLEIEIIECNDFANMLNIYKKYEEIVFFHIS